MFHGAEGAAKALAAERGRTLASLWEELGFKSSSTPWRRLMDEQSVGLDFIADMADALGVSRYSLLASIDGWSDIVSERSCDLMHGPSNDAMLQTVEA